MSFLYATRLFSVLYILVKYHGNILKGFRLMVRIKFYNFGRLWEITPEPSRLELSFLHSTLLSMPSITFHENSSKGIGVMGCTRFCLQIYGQTDTRAIAISPEPLGRGIKRTYTMKGFSYLLCVIGKLNVKLYELINNYYNYIRLILCLIMFLITKQLIIRYTN